MCDSIIGVATGDAIIPASMVPRLLAEFAALAKNQSVEDPIENQNDLSELADTVDETNLIIAECQSGSNLLTPREYQVLELVALGLTNKEIAVRLVISENTVSSHLRCILDKLHMNNRVQAALWLQEQKSISSK
jgi:DNA-binding NarL/FixJ family response regulator